MRDPHFDSMPTRSAPKVPARRGSVPPFEATERDPLDYWHILVKRRWLVGCFFLSVFLVVSLFTFLATPVYTAEALMLIERRPPRISDIESVLEHTLSPHEMDYYETQYEILRSRSLAEEVIREQDLSGHLADSHETAGTDASSEAEKSPSALVGRYVEEWLEVEPMRGTRLVRLRMNTSDPELSARALRSHTRAYMRQGLALRTLASDEARGFLEDSLTRLKQRVEESEYALNAYRRDEGIVSVAGKENVTVERLADLNQRLTAIEADRIAKEAEVRLIRQRDYESLPDVIDNELVTTLKEELARLEGEYAYLSTKFKPGYPRLVQIRAQVAEARRRLRQEVQYIVAGIESAYLSAADQERELKARVEEQKAAALRLKDASVEYAILEREANTNRELYDSVLERMKEMGVAAEVRASNAFVIDEAYAPPRPSSPRKLLNLSLALVLGLVGGIALAGAAEYLDNTLRTPEDVERYLGYATLGVVPDLGRLQSGNSPRLGVGRYLTARWPQSRTPATRREAAISFDLDSAVTETYRSIRTSILLSQASEPPQTVLFTSAGGGEGKTVSTLNAAIMFAQLGPPVLLIDADLRRPRCHDGLGVENGVGLTEVLTGQVDPETAIRKTSTSLSVMLSGATPPNPTELLASESMQGLLALLRKQYSYILIDSPPILPVSDGLVLSQLVDGVILVVNQPDTARQTVRKARERLAAAHAKVLGVVLNRVDPTGPGYAYHGQGYY